MKEKEFKGKKIKISSKPWLGNAWYCLLRGAYHPPIIMVNGKKFHQFSLRERIFSREKLTDYVLGLLS